MSDIGDQTTAFYDAEAFSYDQSRYATKKGQRIERFQKRVLESALAGESIHEAHVLELGCGTGRLLPFMAQRSDTLTGIDISSGMLAVARQRLREAKLTTVRLVRGDASALPFPDNCFHEVYSILVVNLIPDYPLSLQEIRRVLKTGGAFVFSVPNLESVYCPAGYVVNHRGKGFRTNCSGYRYSHWFTRREICAALNKADMTLEAMWGQPPWTTWVDKARPLSGAFPGRVLSKSLYVRARAR